MSSHYQAFVEAVGPSESISRFKALVLDSGTDPQTLELSADRACHVAFNAFTSGPVMNLAHQPPALLALCVEVAATLPNLVVRTQLVTECIYVEEAVYAGATCVFSQSTEDILEDRSTDDRPPVIVHATEGCADAWRRACGIFHVQA